MLRCLQHSAVRKWYNQLWHEHSGTQFLTEAPNLSALMPTGSSPLTKAQQNTGIRDCVLVKGQRGE